MIFVLVSPVGPLILRAKDFGGEVGFLERTRISNATTLFAH